MGVPIEVIKNKAMVLHYVSLSLNNITDFGEMVHPLRVLVAMAKALGFGFKHPLGDSQPSLVPIPLMAPFFSGLCRHTQRGHTHACCQANT